MCRKQVSGSNCQWSHIVSRGNHHLRWDLQNSLVHCYYCHRKWHSSPLESWEWFKNAFPDRYKYLKKEKNIIEKLTVADLEEILSNFQKGVDISY